MSCPHQPGSVPVNSYLWLLSQSLPISYLLFFFFCFPLFCQHYYLFQRTLPSQDVPTLGQLQFWHFCLQRYFRLYLILEPTFPLPALLGIYRALLQHCSSNESFFPYQPSSLSNIVIRNMREGLSVNNLNGSQPLMQVSITHPTFTQFTPASLQHLVL